MSKRSIAYLSLLAKTYPHREKATTELINLSAIVRLPKATEHFLSDLHGEYEAFTHVLRNGSGVIRRRIDDIFSSELSEEERRQLASLIYYPEEKLHQQMGRFSEPERQEYLEEVLLRLVRLLRLLASKYTRSKVRKALPENFAYVIEELLEEREDLANKQIYYESIIRAIIDYDCAESLIIKLCELIQRLAIDHLHVLGDIYDRGPSAHKIMDALLEYHSLDIQWGNHDILWMAASVGVWACIAHVVRISLRYTNLTTLEDVYGISLFPLAFFALETYKGPLDSKMHVKKSSERDLSETDLQLYARMQKAIAIIQFKLEAQLIERNPQFSMDDRRILHDIDLQKGTVLIEGKSYPLNDTDWPTLDKDHPYALSPQEEDLMRKLEFSFKNSDKLQKHAHFLFSKGSLYLRYNKNLLYHGCIPLDDQGEFLPFETNDGLYLSGRALFDYFTDIIHRSYFYEGLHSSERQHDGDLLWYLWSGPVSPLFAKSKMATFERYFIDDKETHKEHNNAYYRFRDDQDLVGKIFREFDLSMEKGHIVNGHVPVKVKKGESPIKAGGRLLVIDGGFSAAYRELTGIGGYTLIFNSYGLLLASHMGFDKNMLLSHDQDMDSQTQILETNYQRLYIRDTDVGVRLLADIEDLKELILAYQHGVIVEKYEKH